MLTGVGAPVTAILLVFEMTGDYAIVPPLMVAVVVCHVVARRLEPDNLYSGWLRRRGEDLAHGADQGVLADDVQVVRRSLEDVFLDLTGRELRS